MQTAVTPRHWNSCLYALLGTRSGNVRLTRSILAMRKDRLPSLDLITESKAS